MAGAGAILEGSERVTRSNANDQLLYFTSTSLLADDSGLVFISDRTGHPNLFCLDFASGEERQLSENVDGVLKSYVYFGGRPYRGFGKASVCLDAARGIVYYVQGRDVCAVDVRSGGHRVLAELPDDQVTAFAHVSADGTRLCLPTTDERALEGAADPPPDATDVPNYYETADPPYDVDERVQVEGLSSYLRIYDTATGAELQRVPVPRAWITHVQFSPSDSSLVLYNHEYCADPGVRRLWLWDGARHRMLRDEGGGSDGRPRSRRDWITHEMWQRDGSHVVYHGGLGRRYHEPPCFVARVDTAGADRHEVTFPDGWNQYGHFTVGRPDQLVTDGYYRTPETADGWGHWITELAVDWEAETIDWRPLTRHGSSWSSQDDHPHPILSHACDAVYFTSDHGGRRAVYRIEVS